MGQGKKFICIFIIVLMGFNYIFGDVLGLIGLDYTENLGLLGPHCKALVYVKGILRDN